MAVSLVLAARQLPSIRLQNNLETWLAKARQADDKVLVAQVQLLRADLLADLGQWEQALELAQSVGQVAQL